MRALAPDLAVKLLPGHQLARAAGEHGQNPRGLGLEPHRPPPLAKLSRIRGELKEPEAQQRACPAVRGLHLRDYRRGAAGPAPEGLLTGLGKSFGS